ncbi:MAG: glutathione S-transferase C-terminal domain-containing protein [Sneathiella sp.]
MGALIDGKWTEEAEKAFREGAFTRTESIFNQRLSQGVLSSIAAREQRYYLIASLSCPWSHRVILVRALKGLNKKLPLVIAKGPRIEGYAVDGSEIPGLEGKNIHHIHQLYALTDPTYSGRATVPLLWDSKEERIICNSSSPLMRSLDDLMEETSIQLVPSSELHQINCLNTRIHTGLSNAVYRAGLARSQAAYKDAVDHVFATLDFLEDRLSVSRYLCGSQITESDLQLFTTLVRFDAVYATHFRCTRKRLVDYPSLWAYARDIYLLPGVSETVDFSAILDGYYSNDGDINPYGIIADLPTVNWLAPHTRHHLASEGPVTT